MKQSRWIPVSVAAIAILCFGLTIGCDPTQFSSVLDELAANLSIGADQTRGGRGAPQTSGDGQLDDSSNGIPGGATQDDNGNDNDENGNKNENENENDNDDNGNDNGGGVCQDGSIRLEGEMDSPAELRAEYRLLPAGCERFRVRVGDYPAGVYDILIDSAVVGTITVTGDGRGEREFDTEDGNFPPDFPDVALGDVVRVGPHEVTLGSDCSADDVDNCNSNSNDNDDNGNDNP